MLTIAIGRIDDLLDKASAVELPLDEETDEDIGTELDMTTIAQLLADDPAFRSFNEALGGLTSEEVYELLALTALARSEASADQWQNMIEEARATAEEDAREALASSLLLTDDIEAALESLGYEVEGNDEGDESKEEGGADEERDEEE